jgi:diamine N-acetyltransferase
LYCNILADNGPSIKLFNRHGFTLSGIKKQWVRDGAEWKDEHLLQLISPR